MKKTIKLLVTVKCVGCRNKRKIAEEEVPKKEKLVCERCAMDMMPDSVEPA